VSRVIAVREQAPRTVAVRDRVKHRVIAAGLRGPKGSSGQVLPPIAFAHGDASPRLIHLLTETQLLVSLQLILSDAFDGEGATLRVRTQAGEVLLGTDQVAPGFPATYESTPGTMLSSGTGIYLEITPGAGSTAGAGFVVLNLN
jgi:hypothetical protein